MQALAESRECIIRKVQKLHGARTCPDVKQAALIQKPRFGAPQLSARCLRYGVPRRQQHTVCRSAQQVDCEGGNPVAELCEPLGIFFPRFGDHDESLCSRVRICRAERAFHCADIRKKIGVREHDPFGISAEATVADRPARSA